MIHKRARKEGKNESICNLAELLSIMAFYRQVDSNLRTADLLKYAGFKIKGLRGTKQAISQGQGHTFIWQDLLSVGMCLCGWKGTEGWTYDMTSIQHGIHTRRQA